MCRPSRSPSSRYLSTTCSTSANLSPVAADVVVGEDGLARCAWGAGDPLYRAYHDEEWGRPLHGDDALFELLTLEGFQAGLAWITILRKRETFRAAFRGLEVAKVARFGARDVARAPPQEARRDRRPDRGARVLPAPCGRRRSAAELARRGARTGRIGAACGAVSRMRGFAAHPSEVTGRHAWIPTRAASQAT